MQFFEFLPEGMERHFYRGIRDHKLINRLPAALAAV